MHQIFSISNISSLLVKIILTYTVIIIIIRLFYNVMLRLYKYIYTTVYMQ